MSKKYTSQNVEEFIGEIRYNVELFKNGVHKHVSNNIVVVLGASGSGKSTLLNMVAQRKFEIKKEKGTWGLNVVGKEYAGEITTEGFEKMAIGYGGDSKTKFPNYIMAGDTQFWDCPGFNKYGTPAIEISNMYYIYYLMTLCKFIRIIIVESSDGTTSGGGESFRNTINNLCELFPSENPKDLIAATTFVFTKIGSHEQQGSEYLIDLLDRVSVKENEANKKVVDFLSAMRKNLDTINHFEIPKVTKFSDHFHTMNTTTKPLNTMIYIVLHTDRYISTFNTKFVLSATALEELQEISRFINNEVVTTIEKVFSKITHDHVQTCYNLKHYKKQITDKTLLPFKDELKSLALETIDIDTKLHFLQSKFVKLLKGILCLKNHGDIEADVHFVEENICSLSKLVNAFDYISSAVPNVALKDNIIDNLCVSLAGEIEQSSSIASAYAEHNEHHLKDCSIL